MLIWNYEVSDYPKELSVNSYGILLNESQLFIIGMYWAMDKEIINIDLNVVLFEITVNCSVIVLHVSRKSAVSIPCEIVAKDEFL